MIQDSCRQTLTLPTDQFARWNFTIRLPALLLLYAEQMTLMTAWRFSTLTALRPRSSAGIISAGSVKLCAVAVGNFDGLLIIRDAIQERDQLVLTLRRITIFG